MDTLNELIDEIGFDDHGECAASDLQTDPRVRDMCSADRCQQFDRNWACPPACGPIEDFQEQFAHYDRCIVLQTVRELEDDYDVETMLEADDIHKERLGALSRLFHDHDVDALILSSGTCTLCPQCSYPDNPCRQPNRRMVSMEAAGLNVTETCKAANVAYNHGPGTITYSGCVLI